MAKIDTNIKPESSMAQEFVEQTKKRAPQENLSEESSHYTEIKIPDYKIVNMVEEAYERAKEDKQEYMSRVNKYRQAFEGNLLDKPDNKHRSSFEFKDAQTMCAWWVANLLDPYMNTKTICRISPRREEDEESAKKSERLINNQFSSKMSKFELLSDMLELISRDGMCAVRLSWKYEYTLENVKKYREDEFGEVADRLFQGHDLLSVNRDEKGNISFVKVGEKTIKADWPVAEVFPVDNIYIDAQVMDINKAKHIIVRRKETVSDLLKKDITRNPKGIYKNVDKVAEKVAQEVASEATDESEMSEAERKAERYHVEDIASERVTVLEFWGEKDVDNDNMTEPVVFTICKGFVLRKAENPYPDKEIPFVFPYYKKKPGEKWPIGVPEYIMAYQKIRTSIFRSVIDKLAYDIYGILGVKKGSLDAAEYRKLKRRDPGTLFEFKTAGDDIKQFQPSPLSPMLPNMIEFVYGEMENHGGFSKYYQGTNAKNANDTATGITAIMTQAQKRVLEVANRVNEVGLKKIFKKMILYNKEFLEQYDFKSNEEYLSIGARDVTTDIDMDIAVSQKGLDMQKAQQVIQLLSNTMPLIQSGLIDEGVVIDLIAKLFELFGFKDIAQRIERKKKQLQQRAMAQRQQMDGRAVENQRRRGGSGNDNPGSVDRILAEIQRQAGGFNG